MLPAGRATFPWNLRILRPAFTITMNCLTFFLNPGLFRRMHNLLDDKFKEWTTGRTSKAARINIFERIRDIPYAVIPELVDPKKYTDILKLNKGSCLPKHLLLCEMYQRLGLDVLYVTYPFNWGALGLNYPKELRDMANCRQSIYHLACKVLIEDKLVLVDATMDIDLKDSGIPVNETWDGISDTRLPIASVEGEEIYHPSEAQYLKPSFTEDDFTFYRQLNTWLEDIRNRPSS